MILITALIGAYLASIGLKDEDYRNPGGWKFPKAEIRAFLGTFIGLFAPLLVYVW